MADYPIPPEYLPRDTKGITVPHVMTEKRRAEIHEEGLEFLPPEHDPYGVSKRPTVKARPESNSIFPTRIRRGYYW